MIKSLKKIIPDQNEIDIYTNFEIVYGKLINSTDWDDNPYSESFEHYFKLFENEELTLDQIKKFTKIYQAVLDEIEEKEQEEDDEDRMFEEELRLQGNDWEAWGDTHVEVN